MTLAVGDFVRPVWRRDPQDRDPLCVDVGVIDHVPALDEDWVQVRWLKPHRYTYLYDVAGDGPVLESVSALEALTVVPTEPGP